MLELEKKVMLSEAEYRCLSQYLCETGNTTVQRNHYYDTHEYAWNRLGVTCRIREIDGSCTATIKAHDPVRMECSIENSRAATGSRDDRLFQQMQVVEQGILETTRHTYQLQPGIVVMLDQNRYLDTVDYELELEYEQGCSDLADDKLKQIGSFLAESGVLPDPNVWMARVGHGKSKSQRFFARKMELAGNARRFF